MILLLLCHMTLTFLNLMSVLSLPLPLYPSAAFDVALSLIQFLTWFPRHHALLTFFFLHWTFCQFFTGPSSFPQPLSTRLSLWTFFLSTLTPLVISFSFKTDEFENEIVQLRLLSSTSDSCIQLSSWHLQSDVWQPTLYISTADLLIPSYLSPQICSSFSLFHLT